MTSVCILLKNRVSIVCLNSRADECDPVIRNDVGSGSRSVSMNLVRAREAQGQVGNVLINALLVENIHLKLFFLLCAKCRQNLQMNVLNSSHICDECVNV